MVNPVPAKPRIIQANRCTVRKRAGPWNSCPEVYRHLQLLGLCSANHTFTPVSTSEYLLVWAKNSRDRKKSESVLHGLLLHPRKAANAYVPAQTHLLELRDLDPMSRLEPSVEAEEAHGLIAPLWGWVSVTAQVSALASSSAALA